MTVRQLHPADEIKVLQHQADSLTKEFNSLYSDTAVFNYYFGKQKIEVANEDGPPKIKTVDFEPHFNHSIGDDVNVKFQFLHPLLQAYFMAHAIELANHNEDYTELKEAMKEAFKYSAVIYKYEKSKPIIDSELDTVFEELESATEKMAKDFGYEEPHAA